MGITKIGIKLDDTIRERIKQAAKKLDGTPHWFIKQAISYYLDKLEEEKHTCQTSAILQTNLNKNIKIPKGLQQPFIDFAEDILPQSITRANITANWYRPENEIVPWLLEQITCSAPMSEAITQLANKLATTLRYQKQSGRRNRIVQDLLQEFSLSSQEGIALMCLAEALLRIPDKKTRDILIRDKIGNGKWKNHLGHSKSFFVNATTWGLLFTGRFVSIYNETSLLNSLNRIISKSSEPLIRKGVDIAVRLIGEQFVTGEHINEALANTRYLEQQGFRYSYDMLGETALIEEDAQAYLFSYEQAIHAIGKVSNGRGIYEGPGISIKLSALHPRYCRAQYERVMTELYPRLLQLTLLAKQYDIGLNIDAEEANRLEISLDLLEKLCFEPALIGWNGIGFVIQAYQKRCPQVINELIDLAKRSKHRLMIRLVKGAYWDSEIKRAQIEGLEGYPVFTRKVYTDLSYLVCARKLLTVPHYIYPQFATHNTHTLAAIYHFAGQNYYSGQYEFQCLYGMGESLYKQVVGKTSEGKLNRPCRIYAPVGTHETLLAYLVRRLLENGANTSFVNRIATLTIPLEKIIADPIQEITMLATHEGSIGLPHPKIPLPRDLYGIQRQNSIGMDLTNEHTLASLSSTLLNIDNSSQQISPIIVGKISNTQARSILNPANRQDIVGECHDATLEDVDQALSIATHNSTLWANTSPINRAKILNKIASRFETEMQLFISLLVRESGKSFVNAISEVREAVDFLRYYAYQVKQDFDNNSCHPVGPVVCISPWNFPLAIFTGQIAAALAVGNTVLAKPAEQTPIIAAKVVMLMLEAGVPPGVLQLLPGKGKIIGAALVSDERTRGVIFTGSTKVARSLQDILSQRLDPQGRLIPFIAETGGINAMLVDSSALTEQVVIDILSSAFDSAGQRCSSLRLLCLQEDIAERTLRMLRGAIAECTLGNPGKLSTDIGPIIDAKAKIIIEKYIADARNQGCIVWQSIVHNATNIEHGTFIPPTIIELTSVDQLKEEIFGPVLHVVRYRYSDLDKIITQINASGYGLTLGLHTRIDETIQNVIEQAHVGNYYINRNIIGAVVGVQPFGGEGLSGTGPKAGGPLYLYRLLSQRDDSNILSTLQSLDTFQDPNISRRDNLQQSYRALIPWLESRYPLLITSCRYFGDISQTGSMRLLCGPTGEQNNYLLLPRKHILCLADNISDLIIQLAAVTSIGGQVLWKDTHFTQELFEILPDLVKIRIKFLIDYSKYSGTIDAVLFHGSSDQLLNLSKTLANRSGPIIGIHSYNYGDTHIMLERLLIERVISINTAAVGGNTNLITIE